MCQRRSQAPGRHRVTRRAVQGRRPALAAVACAAVLATCLSPVGAAPAGAASVGAPIMFGAVGNSRKTVDAHERVLGRTLRGLRVYKNWDQHLFGGTQTWARDTGHTLFMSIDSRRSNGSAVKWADVASARPGSRLYDEMLSQANQIKKFGAQVFIAYNHEPDAQRSNDKGSPAQFVAAWRKVVSVYRAAGATNAKFAWVMTAYSFRRKQGAGAGSYYPGDSYVDDIGADGYNWYQCRGGGGGWSAMSTIFEGQREFGLKHPSKGLMIWEFSSAEDPKSPGRKARWFNDVERLLQTAPWSQYSAVLTWEGRASVHKLSCQFDYLSSRSATAAWKALGTDPAFTAVRVH